MGANGMPDVTPAEVLDEARWQAEAGARELGSLVLALAVTVVVAASGSFPDMVPLWWLLIGAIGSAVLDSAAGLGSTVLQARQLRRDPVAAELAARQATVSEWLDSYLAAEQAAARFVDRDQRGRDLR